MVILVKGDKDNKLFTELSKHINMTKYNYSEPACAMMQSVNKYWFEDEELFEELDTLVTQKDISYQKCTSLIMSENMYNHPNIYINIEDDDEVKRIRNFCIANSIPQYSILNCTENRYYEGYDYYVSDILKGCEDILYEIQ